MSHLRRDEIKEASVLLSKAFEDEPNHSHLYPPEIRDRALQIEFTAGLRDAIKFGHVYGAKQDRNIVGVAIWLPPHTFPLTIWRQVRALPTFLKLFRLSPPAVQQIQEFSESLMELHPEQPYWYLQAVGVHPEHQGKGIGTRLLQPVLEITNKRNEQCWLETADERTVCWYESLGFTVEDSSVSLSLGWPLNWTMSRSPAQS